VVRQFACIIALAATSLLGQNALSNRRAPSFTLPDWHINYFDLLDYRGKVVVIEIMSTTCPHCQGMAATLEKVSAHYGTKIAILSVVLPPDNQSTVRQFIQKYNVTHPVLFDCGQMTESYFKATPENAHIDLPHLFFIDAAGMIRSDFTWTQPPEGKSEESIVNAAIDPLLAGSGSR